MRTDGKMPDHPTAYRSILWNHLTQIQKLVKDRVTWAEIAKVLRTEHGFAITTGAVFNFYKRHKTRKRPLPEQLREHLGKFHPKRSTVTVQPVKKKMEPLIGAE